MGDDVRILTSRGCDLFRDRTEHLAFTRDRIAEAKVVAENSDVVILCMGLDETLEGEEETPETAMYREIKKILNFPEYSEN